MPSSVKGIEEIAALASLIALVSKDQPTKDSMQQLNVIATLAALE